MQNSPLQDLYGAFLHLPVSLHFGSFALDKSLLHWINDGLMAIFFLLVGLEIKREVVQGQLSSRQQIALPAIAALGGMIVPGIIYVLINQSNPVALHGWAIPTATDIAFALGVITLLGSRVPESLKITLVAIAIIDDLGAIVIIALFYTEHLSVLSLAFGSVAMVGLFLLNRSGVTKLSPYMVLGVILWMCVLKSGVHATLAGVVIAFAIPLKKVDASGKSPLQKLEHSLHPWVAYAVLPLFAFANAGVSLSGLTFDTLLEPVTLGIAAGLFFGKQIGIMGATALGKVTGLCTLPPNVNWKQYYGMTLLTGIGFTMSLFIGTLAFKDPDMQTSVRLGVLLGTILSGLGGYCYLRAISKKPSA